MLSVVRLGKVLDLMVSLDAKFSKLFPDILLILETNVEFLLLLVQSQSENVNFGLGLILIIFLCSSIVLNTID